MNNIRLEKDYVREETYEMPMSDAIRIANNVLFDFEIEDSYTEEEIEGLLNYMPSHLHLIRVDIGERDNVSIDIVVRRTILLRLDDREFLVDDNEYHNEDIVEIVNEYGETI